MKVVFAHDAVFALNVDDKRYYNARFNYNIWQRYLKVFDSVTVVGRGRREFDATRRSTDSSVSSGPQVSFIIVPSISGPVSMIIDRPAARKMIENALAESDALIARLPSEIGLLAIKVASRLNKPWAVEVVGHAWDSLWYYGNSSGKLYAPILHLRMKSAVRKSTHTLYVTTQYLQKCYPCEGEMINCSNVDIPTVLSEESLRERIKRVQHKSPPYIIGIVAFMEAKYKGIDTAIKALNSVLKQGHHTSIELRILGGGDYSKWADLADRLGISPFVKFYGTLPPGSEVFKWLDELDLYIQPSLTEGLPRALIEAMSRGLPALGSTAGGIPELLSDTCIFKAGDASHLSRLIISFLCDRESMRIQACRNHNVARQYTKELLDERRFLFWTKFSTYASRHKFSETSRE